MAPSKFLKLRTEFQGVINKKPKFLSNESSDNICYDFTVKLLNNLNLLRRDKRFCDVDIKIGSKIFSVIICSYSLLTVLLYILYFLGS